MAQKVTTSQDDDYLAGLVAEMRLISFCQDCEANRSQTKTTMTFSLMATETATQN